MEKFNITCVILTCDSYQDKGGCIEHTIICLMRQKNVKVEIVIVDNSKQEFSRKKLKRFVSCLHQSNFKIVESNTSIAAGRNIGGLHAKSDIIVFIDDDTFVINNLALNKILTRSEKYKYGYGATRYWTHSINWFLDNNKLLKQHFMKNRFQFLRQNVGEPSPGIRNKSSSKYLTRTFIGNFGYIAADAFRTIGGFPEHFQGYGLEDDAFSFLCYVNYGHPSSLTDIEVVHVTHAISKKCYESLKLNQQLYDELLKTYGYKSFHIGDLLYPEKKFGRPILE